MKRILIIDDEPFVLEVFRRCLERLGYEVATADSWDVARDIFSSEKFDLVLVDVVMPGVSGFDIVRGIKRTNPDQKIIMTTGLGHEMASSEARGKNVDVADFLFKPFSFDDVQSKVESILGPNESVAQHAM